MTQTLTDWTTKHGRLVKFKHVEHEGSVFEGTIRGSTIGKVLIEIPENPEPYVWFLKNELDIL